MYRNKACFQTVFLFVV